MSFPLHTSRGRPMVLLRFLRSRVAWCSLRKRKGFVGSILLSEEVSTYYRAIPPKSSREDKGGGGSRVEFE